MLVLPGSFLTTLLEKKKKKERNKPPLTKIPTENPHEHLFSYVGRLLESNVLHSQLDSCLFLDRQILLLFFKKTHVTYILPEDNLGFVRLTFSSL